jgi:hypothetical protein
VSSRRSLDEESSSKNSLTSRRRPQDRPRPRPLISVIPNMPSDLPDVDGSSGEEEDNQAIVVTPSNKDILTTGKDQQKAGSLRKKKERDHRIHLLLVHITLCPLRAQPW